MKKLFLLFIFTITSCTSYKESQNKNVKPEEITVVNMFIDNWHKAAANADYYNYFDKIAESGRFIGTDAKENWSKKEFADFAKPYFDKGKAWNFTAVQRNVYFSEDGNIAWFDELLDTWMKGCRGSGVLIKQKGEWKIQHYVLSMTIPNEITGEVIPLKTPLEASLFDKQ